MEPLVLGVVVCLQSGIPSAPLSLFGRVVKLLRDSSGAVIRLWELAKQLDKAKKMVVGYNHKYEASKKQVKKRTEQWEAASQELKQSQAHNQGLTSQLMQLEIDHWISQNQIEQRIEEMKEIMQEFVSS
ncbi:hypothetical protein V6N13_053422 [Hibiscus sabdariffa]